jgi:acetyl esterase/lipase
LAALLCTDDHYLKAKGVPLSLVKACVPVDGDTYDVPLQVSMAEERRATSYRKKFGDEVHQKELSPITHVAKGKSIPPFLIIHVAEHPETKLQSERLVAALKAVGVRSATYPAEHTEHVKLNADLGRPDDKPTAAMFQFMEEAVKHRGGSR